jgi:hypothetical protein
MHLHAGAPGAAPGAGTSAGSTETQPPASAGPIEKQ